MIKFWKKYKTKKELEKAKKELREKLEKARFVNFYGKEINLSFGRIIKAIPYNDRTTIISDFDDDYTIEKYYIILEYDNFVERYLFYDQDYFIRNNHLSKFEDFIKSDKYTQLLNQYEKLKEEYEQLL
jgi:hypothetical protein